MTWQMAIMLQILVSSIMTIITRRLALSMKSVFFGVGVLSYLTIAAMGFVFSVLYGHVFSTHPTGTAWLYILTEGLCIPAAWLIQYKIISITGAGNAVIILTANTLGTALLGIVLLNEPLTITFILGAVLIITGSLLALRILPINAEKVSVSMRQKILFVCTGATLYAIGMYAEKQAITSIGVWNYSTYGWGMQFLGVTVIFLVLGRHEIPLLKNMVVAKGLFLGFITSIAGGLYIYALSKGALSHTIIAASGKVALIVLLAAIFLHERNAMKMRITTFLLSIVGLVLIVH